MGKHSANRRGGTRRMDRDAEISAGRSRAHRESAPRRRRVDRGDVPAPASRHRGRTIGLSILAVILVLAAAGVAYAVWFVRSVEADMAPEEPTVERPAPVLVEKVPKEPFTVLLIGADNLGVAGDSRSDSLILAKVDPESKRVWLISIPRDTRAEIPEYGTDKINKAYQLGGAALSVDVVSEMLDVDINHYMEIDIDGFREVVDALGGVWIDVDVEIDDPKAAAANPNKAGRHIEPGYQLLDGNEALVYVRSRDFPDADFSRMRHQQEFFKALAKQSLDPSNLLKLPGMVRSVAQFTTTDMSVSDILDVVTALIGMDEGALETATLKGDWRSPYVYTDEEYMEYLLERFNAGVSFEATSTVTPDDPGTDTPAGSRPEGGATGASTSSILPSDVTVDVRNGSPTSGVGNAAAEILRADGFVIEEVGNAKSTTFKTTTVVYAGDRAEAEMVAEALGIGELVKSDGSWLIDTDVLVVVGSDWPSRTR